ncbi:hypothetical protein AcV7_005015 [Taiwanofungus camphoratus]|nr:hypothetical protein AcV7_005015 [Antrodia cinnamomea]
MGGEEAKRNRGGRRGWRRACPRDLDARRDERDALLLLLGVQAQTRVPSVRPCSPSLAEAAICTSRRPSPSIAASFFFHAHQTHTVVVRCAHPFEGRRTASNPREIDYGNARTRKGSSDLQVQMRVPESSTRRGTGQSGGGLGRRDKL